MAGSEGDVKKLVDAAVKAAEQAPESLRQTVFQEVFRYLSSEGSGGAGETRRNARQNGQRKTASSASPSRNSSTSTEVLVAFNGVDRSRHPILTSQLPVLERALCLLSIGESVGVASMTTGDIVRVLKEKFRISTPLTSISDTLGKSSLVDREKDGRGYRYRLTDAGERHIEQLLSGEVSAVSDGPARRPSRRRARRAKPGSDVPKAAPPKHSRKKASRPGPKAFIEQLINEQFFVEPRAVSDIIQHAKDNKGHTYAATDLTPALTRVLREEKLTRQRGEDGQFHYRS